MNDSSKLVHFVGIGGTGMSALAQYRAMSGGRVSGSDRAFDRAPDAGGARVGRALGIRSCRRTARASPDADLVVDLDGRRGRDRRRPGRARARHPGRPPRRAARRDASARGRRSPSPGSSGKSTVVAMVFEALRGAGLDPGLLTGGELECLKAERPQGQCWVGRDWLVIEADESDKSLLHYAARDRRHPERPPRPLRGRGGPRRLRRSSSAGSEDARDRATRPGARRAPRRPAPSRSASAPTRTLRIEDLESGAGRAARSGSRGVRGRARGARAPQRRERRRGARGMPGRGRRSRGARPRRSRASAACRGASRSSRGPAASRSSTTSPTTRRRSRRRSRPRARARGACIAFFQPHGFAPMKFMRRDLARAFVEGRRPDDRLYPSRDPLRGRHRRARHLVEGPLRRRRGARRPRGVPAIDASSSRAIVRESAAPGDCVLIMGARDPSLGAFARAIGAVVYERDSTSASPRARTAST